MLTSKNLKKIATPNTITIAIPANSKWDTNPPKKIQNQTQHAHIQKLKKKKIATPPHEAKLTANKE